MIQIWILGLMQLFTSAVHAEDPDFVTVYRIRDTVSAMKEYHRMTNTRGFILRNKHYALIDSVRGIHSFTFNPADSSCYKTGNWAMNLEDISDEGNFTIVTDDKEQYGTYENQDCELNNGDCDGLCRYGSCLCSTIPWLLSRATSVSCPGEGELFVHEDLSGHIMTDVPRNLIVAPPNHIIEAVISTECESCYVNVYSPDEQEITVNYFPRTLVSASNIFQINYYFSGFYNHYYKHDYQSDLEVTYGNYSDTSKFGNFEFMCNKFSFSVVKRLLLTLFSESGELTINVHPNLPYLCLSVIFKTTDNSSELQLQIKNDDIINNVPRTLARKVGTWNLSRFEMPLKGRDPLSVLLIGSRTGTIIHSITECNEGNQDVTSVNIVPISSLAYRDNLTISKERGENGPCQNGGIFNVEKDSCNCLPGFVGKRCEKGCGPNSFGNDCKARCSNFNDGCSGIILCKANMPCVCAPGYWGELCQETCPYNSFGASCQGTCGKCQIQSCNIYTGKCPESCLEGFFPPFCQDTYKFSLEAPSVLFKDFDLVTLNLNTSSTSGSGKISYFQVQHKEKEMSNDWLEYPPQRYSSIIVTANVTGLKPGVKYETRIILLAEDGNSYQGDLVPTVEFFTLCRVPESRMYNLNVLDVHPTDIVISWKYNYSVTDYSCLITGYEITIHKNWEKILKNVSTVEDTALLNGLLSGEKYIIEIQALTAFGRAPVSQPVEVKTAGGAPEDVRDLTVLPKDSTRLFVSWNHPEFIGGNITEYSVEYECIKVLACSGGSWCPGQKQFTTTETSVDLVGLLPFSQYFVKVAGKVKQYGPYSYAYGVTGNTVPNAAPLPSTTPVIALTNSSFTANWYPPHCSSLNGYMVGYHYTLRSADSSIFFKGNTTNTGVSFKNLTPETNYLVQIYAVNIAGWNTSSSLNINVTTEASVPERVENLTIYKTSRRMLGLRWSAPKKTYGKIKSYSVSYSHGNNSKLTEHLPPVKCVPWPDMFCHTIKNLIPHKKYIITVGARNENIDADGYLTSVTAWTTEGAPDSPVSLTVVNRTQITVTLQWSPPLVFNGVLRSFVINMEQVDSANTSDCCEYYPVQEVVVKEELQFYSFVATDLKPASKYSFSVSSKTLAIGPSVNVTTNTLPEEPEVSPPEVVDYGSLWSVRLSAPLAYPGVNSIYLLLVLPGPEIEEAPSSEIRELEVMNLLQAAVNGSFYIIKEMEYDELLEETEVPLGTDAGPQEGVLGVVQDPVLSPGEYRVALAVLLDYGGAKAVGLAASNTFNV